MLKAEVLLYDSLEDDDYYDITDFNQNLSNVRKIYDALEDDDYYDITDCHGYI